MNLQVLLVEDDPGDLKRLARDLKPVFEETLGLSVTIHEAETFDLAFRLVRDPHRRFDLILSDTYKGPTGQGDAAVLEMVNEYRSGRFAPLIVFSTGARPAELKVGAFVLWADKTPGGEIETAIRRLLATGVPQAAHQLHKDIDQLAGNYLWEFLEENWSRLEADGHVEPKALARLIRRRAALQIAEIEGDGSGQVQEVHGLEFYMYPPLHKSQYSLGQVIRHKRRNEDVRVILTPHCFLVVQPNAKVPRAEYVRVVKAVAVDKVLTPKQIEDAKKLTPEAQLESFVRWTRPPSRSPVGKPEGRYWYMPKLLDIPHLYCDLLQQDSLPYAEISDEWQSLAVLAPPYAESLQSCSQAFNGWVGIPNLMASSVKDLLG